jgi:uncharacterized protein
MQNGRPLALVVTSLLIAVALLTSCGGDEHADTGDTTAAAMPAIIGSDREVRFASGGVEVHGSLRLPADPTATVPAALIIVGSGQTDRNGNAASQPDVKMDMYKWLADQLSHLGYASFRYDKLGSGATAWGPYTEREASKISFEKSLLLEAQDALAYLARQPGVDPSELVIVGHSEGGMIALAVADDPGTAPRPARLALVEPLPIPILELIKWQLAAQVDGAATAGAISPTDRSALRNWLTVGIDELRQEIQFSHRPPPLPNATGATAGLQDAIEHYVYNPTTSTLRRTENHFDPRTLAAADDAPASVLVTCGTKDITTPCSMIESLATAFPPGLADLAVIPDMVHVLRDIGDADPETTTLDELLNYPYSQRLAEALAGFLG